MLRKTISDSLFSVRTRWIETHLCPFCRKHTQHRFIERNFLLNRFRIRCETCQATQILTVEWW